MMFITLHDTLADDEIRVNPEHISFMIEKTDCGTKIGIGCGTFTVIETAECIEKMMMGEIYEEPEFVTDRIYDVFSVKNGFIGRMAYVTANGKWRHFVRETGSTALIARAAIMEGKYKFKEVE